MEHYTTIGLNKERPTTNVNTLLEFRRRFLDGGICAETTHLNKMFIHNFCLSCRKIRVYMRKIEMICDDVSIKRSYSYMHTVTEQHGTRASLIAIVRILSGEAVCQTNNVDLLGAVCYVVSVTAFGVPSEKRLQNFYADDEISLGSVVFLYLVL